MSKALLVRRAPSLRDQRSLFAAFTVLKYGDPLQGSFTCVVVAFEENTQREIEWVEDAKSRLRAGGKFLRLG